MRTMVSRKWNNRHKESITAAGVWIKIFIVADTFAVINTCSLHKTSNRNASAQLVLFFNTNFWQHQYVYH